MSGEVKKKTHAARFKIWKDKKKERKECNFSTTDAVKGQQKPSYNGQRSTEAIMQPANRRETNSKTNSGIEASASFNSTHVL